MVFIQSALLYSNSLWMNCCITSTNNGRSGILDVDDGSTIYLPFYHCSITVCITVCWCCRVLVMPVLLLLIVIVSVIIAINGYSCYSVAVYCWIACESCKLFITSVVRACTITITLLVV